jgi:hypothetical protein
MAIAAGTDAVADVVNDVVQGTLGQIVQLECVTNFPGDDVIGADDIAGDAEGADELACFSVEWQSPGIDADTTRSRVSSCRTE